MKIVFATDYLPVYHNTWGGGEQACFRIARILSRNGYDITVLSTRPDRIPDEDFNFQRLRVVEDFFPKGLRYTLRQLKSAFFPFDIVSFISSYFILRKIKPDILHLHNIHCLSFSLAFVARILKIPVIISIYDYGIICPIGFLWKLSNFSYYEGVNCDKFHGTHCFDCIIRQKTNLKYLKFILLPLLFFRQKFLDNLIAGIKGFIVLSESNAMVLKDYGIKEERIGVVQIPLDEPDFKQKIEENSILFIGWLHPRKGPHVAVRAMTHVLKQIPSAKLYILGDEKSNRAYKDDMVNFIKMNNLSENVFLLGRKPYNKVKEYLKKANVLVIPETWETIATNTLTEGLTYGIAIVASRVGGSKDYIEDGHNGLLAENNNPLDFADKVVLLLKDKKLQVKLQKNARGSWERLFSEKKVYNRLINFYNLIHSRSSIRTRG